MFGVPAVCFGCTLARTERRPERNEALQLAFAYGKYRNKALRAQRGWKADMHIFWIILVGFIAGIIARHLLPRPNNPSGFILTTLLGIAGAFVAGWLGHAVGRYENGEGAGFIAAIVGAFVILLLYRLIAGRCA